MGWHLNSKETELINCYFLLRKSSWYFRLPSKLRDLSGGVMSGVTGGDVSTITLIILSLLSSLWTFPGNYRHLSLSIGLYCSNFAIEDWNNNRHSLYIYSISISTNADFKLTRERSLYILLIGCKLGLKNYTENIENYVETSGYFI